EGELRRVSQGWHAAHLEPVRGEDSAETCLGRRKSLMRVSLLCLSVLCAPLLAAQQDGPGHPFQDSLVAQLAGEWSMTGDMRGQAQSYTMKAEWVLGHQFLRMEMKGDQYEAVSYIGYDNASERYVAHWIDIFGGRVSETLGYGKREGNSIHFVFEY